MPQTKVLLSKLKEQFTSTNEFFCVDHLLMPRTGGPVSYGGIDPDPIFHNLQCDKPGVDGIDFGRPEFFKSAKRWDCFTWLSGPYFRGLFLSTKAAEVFSRFNLGVHRFYPFKALHNGEELNYCYLHICSDETDHVDFSDSTFYVEDRDSDILDRLAYSLHFKTRDEYEAEREKFTTNAIHALDLKLNGQFDKSLDLFTFMNLERKTIISQRLKEAIEKAKLTGFKIYPLRIRA